MKKKLFYDIIRKYWTLFLLLIVFVLNFIVFEQLKSERIFIFNPNNFAAVTIFSLIAIFLNTLFIALNYKRVNLNKKYPLIISMSLAVLFIIGLANIFVVPKSISFSLLNSNNSFVSSTLNILIRNRMSSLYLLVINIEFAFILLILLPRLQYIKSYIRLISYSFVIYGVILVIYSAISEHATYQTIFNTVGTSSFNSSRVATSLYDNRNTFASFLLTSMLFSLFLYYINRKNKLRFILLVTTFVFFWFIMLTYSKTNIMLSLASLLFVVIVHLVKSWKSSKLLFYIDVVILFAFSIFFVVLLFVPLFQITLLGRLLKSIFSIDFFFKGGDSLQSRFLLWRLFFNSTLNRPIALIFGDGVLTNRLIYGSYLNAYKTDLSPSIYGNYHNGFIEVYAGFGVFGLVFYLAILCVVFLAILKLKNKKTTLQIVLVMLFFVFFVLRSSVEAISFMLFKIEGIVASLTVMLPLIYFLDDDFKQVQRED